MHTFFLLLASFVAHAQYTPSAGTNAPTVAYEQAVDDAGRTEVRAVAKAVERDTFGNATGNQYDLAVDGAFAGQTVLVLDQVGNTLEDTRAALLEKGLAMVAYRNGTTPPVAELEAALARSCQLWLISAGTPLLGEDHIRVIRAFFEAGHGVYVWGDNQPYYTDANRVAGALVPGLRMEGDLAADQVVGIAGPTAKAGVRAGHLITTGLEHLYEGVTIATVQFTPADGRDPALFTGGPAGPSLSPPLPPGFTPLLHGSAGNLVSVAYERDGKRLVMDGGFTRLAVSWDDAGTARFVKNAASWLVNSERFGDTVAVRAD